MSQTSRPRLQKGAIIGLDIFNPLASVISFQYNPETLSRSIKPRTGGGKDGAKSEALRLSGAPEETISLKVEIDLADQLDTANSLQKNMGIYPQLSALEMLVYPKSSLVIANTLLLAMGTIEIIPSVATFTLFIWGPRRVLPVQVTSFSITEQMHDVNLNPIRAEVSLELKVLSYSDLEVSHPGYHLFLAHQVVKETMAVIGSAGNV